jgi:hypothetical protein
VATAAAGVGCAVGVSSALAGTVLTGAMPAGAVLAGSAAADRPGSAAADLAGSAAKPAACKVFRLPTPAGAGSSEARAADPTGRYVIGSAWVGSGADRHTVALFWDRTALVDLPVPAGSSFVDVNSRGVVVGLSASGRGWVYRRGEVTELPVRQAGQRAVPAAVNTRGDVVGFLQGADVADRQIAVWPAHRPAAVRTLALPPGPISRPQSTDIDDDGTVIATANDPADFVRVASYYWPRGGAPVQFRTPDGGDAVAVGRIRRGWVVGVEYRSGSQPVLRWNLRTSSVEQVRANGTIRGVNARGAVLTWDAVIHRDGTDVPLPGLVPGGVVVPEALTDRFDVVGEARDGADIHAVVWRDC